ncbi:receptor activity-modifying protein 3-like [Plectropomus leopardus]|uniref:receptor activity-modifying protein 3-like n=1 Tax=Plectropomus leopardus TaxID=160734 RepID=UPI001C4D52D7|nr:receptor activity-modifying protein 3-like [Plectropomus leopardus]
MPSPLSTMILYLLYLVLILSNVESQTVNVTGHGELSKFEGNETFIESTTNNSTMKPDNVTSSLYKDEKNLIEDALQNNQTDTFIREEDENFQDQKKKFLSKRCNESELVYFSYNYCGVIFDMEMTSISTEKWCILEDIIRPYYSMTNCLEKMSDIFDCNYPDHNIQSFFLYIHSNYFHNCSREELPPLVDAPQGVVIVLTLIPVSLIPVLVYLVVWKSNVQK